MGAVASRAIKPFKNWNILNRAIKQIEKDKLKPRSASKIPQQMEFISESIENNKNVKLVEEINKFEISSTEVIEGKRVPTKSNRPLPKKVLPYDLDDNSNEKAVEPVIIPEGKITISLLIEMMEKYRDDITIEELADLYKLPPEKVYNILRFNRLFVLTPPDNKLRLLIEGEPEKSQSKGPTLLYPESYGKCAE